MRRFWTEAENAKLRAGYPDRRTDELAAELGRTLSSTFQQARKLGLCKSDAYLATDNACRIQRGKQNAAMKAAQFKPGLTPWNKGVKGSTGTHEACRATQFKPGRRPEEARNYQPIGSLRICSDGYLEKKVTDDASIAPARRWVAFHRLVWENKNGPVPSGHVVVFQPGKKTTDPALVTVDILDCINRGELMRRNSYHTNYPPELARVIQLRGAINRQINQRAKESA